MSDILLSIVAGLVLFLFAISQLSDSLKAAVGLRANDWIAKFTSTTLSSILVGTIMTVLLDSSSAVIIITIVLVNAKILKFRQAMGIVLGANIGTTFSSQVIAMDVGKFSPILLLIGFVFMFVTKTRSDNSIGKVIFLFGILFFGLYTIELAVEPLKEEPFMLEWLKKTDDPLFGSMAGALATLVIQSSSATVGMAIVLSKKGLLSLAGGVAIMLGAELGTCSDTLLATIKGSRAAVKTGLFHLIFNLCSIIIGLILFYPFVKFVEIVSEGAPVERAIANAHMLFNIAGVLVFVWFVPLFERMLNTLLPDRN